MGRKHDCYQVNLQVKLSEEDSCLYSRYGPSLFDIKRVDQERDHNDKLKMPSAAIVGIDIDRCDCTKSIFSLYVSLPGKKPCHLCACEESNEPCKPCDDDGSGSSSSCSSSESSCDRPCRRFTCPGTTTTTTTVPTTTIPTTTVPTTTTTTTIPTTTTPTTTALSVPTTTALTTNVALTTTTTTSSRFRCRKRSRSRSNSSSSSSSSSSSNSSHDDSSDNSSIDSNNNDESDNQLYEDYEEFESCKFVITTNASGHPRELITFLVNPLPYNVVSSGVVDRCYTYEMTRVPCRKLKDCHDSDSQCCAAKTEFGGNTLRVMFPLTKDIKCLVLDLGLSGTMVNYVLGTLVKTKVRIVSRGPIKFAFPALITFDKESCTVCLEIFTRYIAQAKAVCGDGNMNGYENRYGVFGCVAGGAIDCPLDLMCEPDANGANILSQAVYNHNDSHFFRLLASSKKLDVMGVDKCVEKVLFSFQVCHVPYKNVVVDKCGKKYNTVFACEEDAKAFKSSYRVMSDVGEYSYEYLNQAAPLVCHDKNECMCGKKKNECNCDKWKNCESTESTESTDLSSEYTQSRKHRNRSRSRAHSRQRSYGRSRSRSNPRCGHC